MIEQGFSFGQAGGLATQDVEIAAGDGRRVRERGRKVATAHLVHLNPMPANTGEVVKRYAKVLIPELNTGQLSMLIRSAHLVDAMSFSKVQGQPIFAEELEVEILKVMDG